MGAGLVSNATRPVMHGVSVRVVGNWLGLQISKPDDPPWLKLRRDKQTRERKLGTKVARLDLPLDSRPFVVR